MKSIRHKILFFTLLPFLVVFSVFSVLIVYQVYQIQKREIQRHLYNMALYNESHVRHCFDTLVLSAQFCAAELEKIDPADPLAREEGAAIITSRFRNSNVINAWLAFEPNAFDGQDASHTDDYPGAPSGRYIRSYVRSGDSWDVLHDMDEAKLDDINTSYYYAIPMETGNLFSDLGSHSLLWDYGKGLVSSIGVTMPVKRDGKIIGCVGLDANLNEEMMGGIIYENLVSTIYLPDGSAAYSRNTGNINKTLEVLGFKKSAEIRETMRKSESGYFNDVYSGITDISILSYFHPIRINGQYIYICTTLPWRDIWHQLIPVLLPISLLFVSTLIALSFLFVYLSRDIAVPLKKLAEASERIVSGNLEASINTVNSKDEMGMISKSLARMAEQFRIGRYLQEKYTDRFGILLRIHYALFRSASLGEAFGAMLGEVAEYYGISKGILVFIGADKPKIVAVYPQKENAGENPEFFSHAQVVELLQGKKHFTVNGSALEAVKLPFLDFYTKSLCLLSIRINDVLSGYIIMEGKRNETLINDDTTLLFISDVLGYLINSKVEWERNMTRPVEHSSKARFSEPEKTVERELFSDGDEEDFFEKAKAIQNLDVEKGILLIGGEKKKYTELLKVTIKVISEAILKMRRFHTEDIAAFAIEVHGIKAVLFNIGAEALGDEARQLEFAAKSDDAVYCREHYPALEEKLRIFSRNLAALFPRETRNPHKGDVEELEKALVLAGDACDNFDVSAVASLLAPLTVLDWNSEFIQKSLQDILSDTENLEYEKVKERIVELFSAIRDDIT